MECNLKGAVIRDNPADPGSAVEYKGGHCGCHALENEITSPYMVIERTRKGKPCKVFNGCKHLLSGAMEKVPDEWPPMPENLDIDLWMDHEQTEPTKAKVKQLKCRKGKERKMKRSGIKHEKKVKKAKAL